MSLRKRIKGNIVDVAIKLEKEIIKKDKIIDEMANILNYLDIDRFICDDVGVCPLSKNYSNKTCKKCIIEYFERKVENEEEKSKKR